MEGTRSDRMWPRLAHCGFGILPWERVFATLSHRYRCAVLLAGGRTTHLFETRKHFLRLPWMTLHRNGRSDKLRSPARKTGQRWRATRAPKREGVQRRRPRSRSGAFSFPPLGPLYAINASSFLPLRYTLHSVPGRLIQKSHGPSVQAMFGLCRIGRSNHVRGLLGHEGRRDCSRPPPCVVERNP